LPSGSDFSFDVCIIGGGPAGISIARELANSETRVVLLESGGLWLDEDIEALHTLVVTGQNYETQGSRLRYFGGSSNHWSGHCLPMPAESFQKREWIPESGWPFGIDELHPYYARAHEVIGIGPYDYRSDACAERVGESLLPLDPNIVRTQITRIHRLNFGMRYAEDLDAAENISVFLYATVTSINLDENKRFVSDVAVRTLDGNSFAVRAKYFILATGGIENARLLLLSNRDMSGGLGNQNDLVGRYFMEHPFYFSGFILPVDQNVNSVGLYKNEMYYDEDYDIRGYLVLSEASNRELRIPDFRAQLDIRHTRRFSPGVRSLASLSQFLESFDATYLTVDDVVNVMSDLSSPVRYLTGDKDAPLVYGFENHCEQVPNPDSRVTLSDTKDALGQNRAKLHWQLSQLDIEGIGKAQRLIAQEVGRAGIGRMKVFVPSEDADIPAVVHWVRHHIGTTRMNDDPKRGVVDSNCRIHGLENIYIAGSSVFPTESHPSPTLTLTALAIRLADHLKAQFERS
jgi:choline dehydrogenase-like flavoprotein